MIHTIIKKTTCTDYKECSNSILEKLETKLNCVLHADEKIKTVNGSLSILHEKNNHTITIEFYDKDEKNNEITFKKLSKIPGESEIKKVL